VQKYLGKVAIHSQLLPPIQHFIQSSLRVGELFDESLTDNDIKMLSESEYTNGFKRIMDRYPGTNPFAGKVALA